MMRYWPFNHPRRGMLAVWAVFALVAGIGLVINHFSGPSAPAVLAPPPAAPLAAPLTVPPAAGGDLPPLVQRLREKLALDPGNGEGWLLLARAHGQLQQYGEAVTAYRRAAEILAPDAGLLTEWVEAQVMANQGQWDEAARQVLRRAQAVDPRHVKTLALAGSEAFGRHDYAAAIEIWRRMKAAAPPGSTEARLAELNIAEAERRRDGKS